MVHPTERNYFGISLIDILADVFPGQNRAEAGIRQWKNTASLP